MYRFRLSACIKKWKTKPNEENGNTNYNNNNPAAAQLAVDHSVVLQDMTLIGEEIT